MTKSEQQQTRQKYLELFLPLYEKAEFFLKQTYGFDLTITPISDNAIRDWYHQWPKLDEWENEWDWGYLMKKKRHGRLCKRVDIAVYHEGVLVCLALGRISKGKRLARIDYLQRKPNLSGAIKGKTLNIIHAIFYSVAEKADCHRLCIMNPEKKLQAAYAELGFMFETPPPFNAKAHNIMYKELKK
jgi:hypothetical protein